jgi:hypothetical protein
MRGCFHAPPLATKIFNPLTNYLPGEEEFRCAEPLNLLPVRGNHQTKPMYRFLLHIFFDTLILGAALVAAFRIGGRHINVSLLVGALALLLIGIIVRSLPLLRMLSTLDELRRTANEENQDGILDIMNENFKPIPIFSPQTFVGAFVILALGLVMRAFR